MTQLKMFIMITFNNSYEIIKKLDIKICILFKNIKKYFTIIFNFLIKSIFSPYLDLK